MKDRLRPFFWYFGSKWTLAPKYPVPKYPTIVEPFAGSAAYGLLYYDRQIVLCEANPKISALWRYLIRVRESEIKRLPTKFLHTGEFSITLPEEARTLIGMWLGSGTSGPRPGKSHRSNWTENVRDRIASQVDLIRHWQVKDDYRQGVNAPCVWFVDPPYNNRAGGNYKYKPANYYNLGAWCRSRLGQVIVCENEGATWLPFRPFSVTHGQQNTDTQEVIWYRDG